MSELPKGWIGLTLGDIGKWSSGGTPSRRMPSYYGSDIPWVKTGDLRDAVLSGVPEAITNAGLANSSARVFPVGTLLIAMYGATIGRTAVLGVPAATNQACAALIAEGNTTELIPYVWWYLRSKTNDLKELGQGGAQPNISQEILKALPISIPPLAEQRRIVEKLDALTARTARARADLDRIPALASRYRLSLLRAAARGELTESWRQGRVLESAERLVARTPAPDQGRGGRAATSDIKPGQAGLSINDPGTKAPDGWTWIPLLRIARQETGHTPSRSKSRYWGGDVPWVGIKDAGSHHGRTIDRTLQTITEDGLANSSARLLPKGTVCLSRTASVGYVTILGRPMATSQDFAAWTCSEALLPEYLMLALMAEGDDIRDFGEGTTHTTIYFPEIRALTICLPPLSEQQEIVERVKQSLADIDRMVTEAAAARRLLDRLDQAVLAKAFRGELVPQEPSDEPASVLLDRIRAERAAAPTAKRGRRKTAA